MKRRDDDLMIIDMYDTRDLNDEQKLIIESVRRVCSKYNEDYWKKINQLKTFPEDFIRELEELGLLGLPIPKEYGGPSLGLREATLVLEEINANGGTSQHLHGQYYLLFVLSKFGNEKIKEEYLPRLAEGKLRLQTLALTEPEVGSDIVKIKTVATKQSNKYIITGHKIFISRVLQTDLMLVVARTKQLKEVRRKTDGLSLFIVDVKKAVKDGTLKVNKINTVINSETYELFLDGLTVPEEHLVGNENEGFRHLLEVLNPERILVSAECIGDARWFLSKSVDYAKIRVTFDRPIGSNQGIQFPLAIVYAKILAASNIMWQAAKVYDSTNEKNTNIIGKYANIAKFIASDCSTEAANIAMDTFGAYGMTEDAGIVRKLMENRLYRIAPISQNLVLSYIAHNILGLPRSF
ncbi:MAG: acyl-CoA dehydrogenase family protein [Conexivisphaerales archaeon]